MGGPLEFEGSSVRAVLQDLVDRRDPLRLQVRLRGPATALADRAVMRTASGRVHLVRTADRSGVDALVRVILADGGTIDVLEDPPPDTVQHAPTLDSLFLQAERQAQQLLQPIEPCGGLGAVLRTDLSEMVVQLQRMPEAANRVMGLADGQRTVADILAASSYSEVLTARILGKLHGTGVLMAVDGEPPPPEDDRTDTFGIITSRGTQWVMPDKGWGETSELPGEDGSEVEGPEVSDDVASWLSTGDAPPPLMSDAAFAEAFVTAEMPAVRAPRGRGLSLRRGSSTRGGGGDDGGEMSTSVDMVATRPRGRSFRGLAVTVGLVGAAVGVALALGVDEGDLFGTAAKGGAEAAGPTAEPVALAASAPVMEGPRSPEPPLTDEPEPDLMGPVPDALRRTIAAADAPAEVKEAESLWETGQFGDAARVLRTLRQTRPDDATIFVLSGQVFVDTGRLTQANAMVNRALVLNRRSFRAWVLKGSVLQFENHPRKALAAYRRALKLGPDHEMSDEIRALIAQLEGDLSGDEREY